MPSQREPAGLPARLIRQASYEALPIPNTTRGTPQRHLHAAPGSFSGDSQPEKTSHRDTAAQNGSSAHSVEADVAGSVAWTEDRSPHPACLLLWRVDSPQPCALCQPSPQSAWGRQTWHERHRHTEVTRHELRLHGKRGRIRTCAWVRMACSSGHGGGACRGGAVTEGVLRSDPVGLAVPVTFLAGAGAWAGEDVLAALPM